MKLPTFVPSPIAVIGNIVFERDDGGNAPVEQPAVGASNRTFPDISRPDEPPGAPIEQPTFLDEEKP